MPIISSLFSFPRNLGIAKENVLWYESLPNTRGFPGGSVGKEFAMQETSVQSGVWVGKIPWRREWQPTPVLLPGGSHGQRSLAGYSPWSRKEWDMAERYTSNTNTQTIEYISSPFWFFHLWKLSFVFCYLMHFGEPESDGMSLLSHHTNKTVSWN